uniref:Polysaccharide biosynthesis protein n=1 Tax=Magnetococcus massalia (strain MO-1) TaxID=451514 RepID=A0A1S7LG38_MAGMO|nr:Membrane protein of unknown function. Putative membrane protein involved in the export of O-antigen and teichoic acid [Candidatus Magnetococcus massalia]
MIDSDQKRQNELSRIGSWTIIQMMLSLLSIVVNLPLQIYIARTLGSEAIGTLVLLLLYGGTIANLLELGITHNLEKHIPHYTALREDNTLRRLILGSYLALFSISLLATLLLIPLGDYLYLVPWLRIPDALLDNFILLVSLTLILSLTSVRLFEKRLPITCYI